MKKLTTIASGILMALMANATIAEPVMNLITVNTKNAAAYAGWVKDSAPAIIEANSAMAMGLCSPTSGAQEAGDHYLWSLFDSQETAWQGSPSNPVVQREVAKMDFERTIRTRDNWRMVRVAETLEQGHYYNMYVETNAPGSYLAGLDALKAEMDKRGLGISMQVFIGDTGETAGTVMISLGAEDPAVLGRAMDARSEPWFTNIVSSFEAERTLVHGFSMTCQTYATARQ